MQVNLACRREFNAVRCIIDIRRAQTNDVSSVRKRSQLYRDDFESEFERPVG
jgi:hypothetical protein